MRCSLTDAVYRDCDYKQLIFVLVFDNKKLFEIYEVNHDDSETSHEYGTLVTTNVKTGERITFSDDNYQVHLFDDPNELYNFAANKVNTIKNTNITNNKILTGILNSYNELFSKYYKEDDEIKSVDVDYSNDLIGNFFYVEIDDFVIEKVEVLECVAGSYFTNVSVRLENGSTRNLSISKYTSKLFNTLEGAELHAIYSKHDYINNYVRAVKENTEFFSSYVDKINKLNKFKNDVKKR